MRRARNVTVRDAIRRSFSAPLKQGTRSEEHAHLRKFGSEYGGWLLPQPLDQHLVCYAVGVGEDVSFEMDLLNEYDWEIHSFDPTPRAQAFVADLMKEYPRWSFHPFGVWIRNESVRFYAPERAEHVSHSVTNLQKTSQFFVAECLTLNAVKERLGHDRIHILKLDVEEAEYAIISQMLRSGPEVDVFCVEFHRPWFKLQAPRILWRLLRAGYIPVARENWDVTFCLTGAFEKSPVTLSRLT